MARSYREIVSVSRIAGTQTEANGSALAATAAGPGVRLSKR